MDEGDFVVVYTTVGSREDATEISRTLVCENLAACVQSTPIKSVYRWKGKLNEDDEILLACKTTKKNYAGVEKRIKELHPYECPEIIAVPVIAGSKDYLKWVRENTKE